MNREKRRLELRKFGCEKTNYKNKMFEILFFGEADDVSRIFRALKKNSQLLSKLKLVFFPKDLTAVCSKKFIYNEDIQDDTLHKVYFWILSIFSSDINLYMSYKITYEAYLVNERYEEALNILECIEKDICVSYWSCCQKMMLTEMIYGLEEHKKIMSYFLSNSGSNLIFDTLIEFKSFFVEKNTSYLTYQNRIKDFLNSIKDQDVAHLYFDYKLNMEYEIKDISQKIFLQFDAQFSIIDLYECYIQNVNLVMSDHKELVKEINDFRLSNKLLIQDYSLLKNNNFRNIDYYKTLDDYSVGDYDSFIKASLNYLNEKPLDFQFVILLIKALINNKEHVSSAMPTIYKAIYSIYTMDTDYENSIFDMYHYLKIFNGNIWDNKIRGFIARKVTLKYVKENITFSSINDYLPMPNIALTIDSKTEAFKFLDTFYDYCPITMNLYKQVLGNQDVSNVQIKDVTRKRIFESDNLIINGEYEDACRVLILQRNSIAESDLYNIEKINKRLVVAYLNCGRYLELTRLIASSYLTNEHLVRRINVRDITDKIKKTRDVSVFKDIHFVILTYICDSNDYKSQRIAYSNYMNHNNYTEISDLISSNEDKKALVFFLEKICTVHLLKRDIILNPTFDKTDEIRVGILWRLIELENNRKKVFYEEISNITKQRSIKDRIKQINQSRVYVDVENIKKENSVYLSENFDRYLVIKDFNDEVMSIDITSNEYIEDLKKIVTEMNEKIRVNPSFSQKIVILKSIISKITEEFLFNEKYGLNTFLSSRIRHGYCKSQLISVFQDHNLLSKKEHNESQEYNINEHWDLLLPKNSEDSNYIKKQLSQFTQSIEMKIEEIRSSWLCIKYKEENDAYLDYTNCVNSCLIIENDNIIDYDAFFKEVIDYLWGYTESNFQKLRERIESELMDSFIESLSKLENELASIGNNDFDVYIKQISAAINKCKSQIKGKVSEFANVFYKRDVDYKDFNMSDLVDACLEISGKLNGDFSSVQLTKQITDDSLYKGEVFPYFVDILNILINNAIEHSGFLDVSEMSLDIRIEREKDMELIEYIKDELIQKGIKFGGDNFSSITISNNVSLEVDIERVKEKIDKIFKDMKIAKSLKKYTQSEGGTGLYKLYKTLQYNIHAPYTIIYKFEHNILGMQIVFGIDRIIESGVK